MSSFLGEAAECCTFAGGSNVSVTGDFLTSSVLTLWKLLL